MATIVVELEKVNTSELTVFLVEEPEAHLHPQLQAAVLHFLEEQAEKSRKPKPDANMPAGHLQIVVATHSPNLAAWVNSKNLVFFRSTAPRAIDHSVATQAEPAIAPAGEMVVSPQSAHPATPAEVDPPQPPSRRVTRTIPLSQMNLTDLERRKIDRYLDVTKSAFLFGGRVLLVEGIAEALLLPVIAKHVLFKESSDKYRQFRSSVFVPIDSVDFEPYVKLLLASVSEIHIADRVIVITDGDKGTLGDGEKTPGERRKDLLTKLAGELEASTALEVFINTYSLESELVRAGNVELMKKAYLELHPRSVEKWNAAIAKEGNEQAAEIQKLFETIRKGDFAHVLAEQIIVAETFHVPSYIKDAIEALVR